MTQSTGQARLSAAEVLAAAGITVTDEGRAAYRERAAAARAEMTPDVVNEIRDQVGLPPLDRA